ncbi:MAG: DoxX family membrane protein [Saprospiraceae bacterium]|nr:DoxX family membrane protein [Saprospiraceae bacterium]
MTLFLPDPLVWLIENLKRRRIIQVFAIFLRYLIGSAFIFAGLPKVLGQRFTSMPVETPVGFYFEAMYQTGFYWNFLGWGQVVAALLLITQRFATLGAVMFYPIMINIWLVTWSIGFKGTPTVTFLMFLANTWLLLWDYRKFAPLFQQECRLQLPPSDFDDGFMRKPVWAILGLGLALCSALIRLDFAHAGWYVAGGFLTALGFLVYGMVIKIPAKA